MKLYVAATGSSGNAYALIGRDGETLFLDAGEPCKALLPHLPNIRKVKGVCLTHEHFDHSRYVGDYLLRGYKVFASAGTWQGLGRHYVGCKPMHQVKSGPFTILPFETQHDAAEPFGFLIRYRPTGETVLYATDTYYLRYTFPGVNYWIVECNYCEDLIDAETDAALRNRLKESHMSLRRLQDTFRANDLREAAKIVLVHLSDKRSDEQRMVFEIERQTGIETVAASPGMMIDLELTPF